MSFISFQKLIKLINYVDLFSDQMLKAKEVDIIYEFYQLLKAVSKKKKQISYVDPQTEQMIIKEIGLEELLFYMTGSLHISNHIRSNKITIEFRHDNAHFNLNTCILKVTLPVNEKYLDSFTETFFDALANSPGFTRA